ncbi:hypothetical protein FDF08_05250 [Micrococcus luteus]|nr:hypothetical protein FDF08_05250 [Micrococcus luteus]
MSGTSPTDPQRGQNPYGQEAPGPSPYGENPYGAHPYGQAPYGQGGPAQGQPGQGHPNPGHPAPSYADQGYPAQGGWPGQQAPGPLTAPRRPGAITASFWLILAGGLVLLASTLLAAFAMTLPESRAMLEQQMRETYEQMGLPADQLAQMEQMTDQLLPVMSVVAAAFGVVAFLVYLLIALKIRKGSRAARTVGTVLAALSVLMIVTNLMMGAFNPFDLLWVGLGVAGIVMAFRPEASEYMRLKAWERAGTR